VKMQLMKAVYVRAMSSHLMMMVMTIHPIHHQSSIIGEVEEL
jgi:hypothetical protein